MTTLADTLHRHARELVTMTGTLPAVDASGSWDPSPLGLVRDGAVASLRGVIVAVGTSDAVERAVTLTPDATVIDVGDHVLASDVYRVMHEFKEGRRGLGVNTNLTMRDLRDPALLMLRKARIETMIFTSIHDYMILLRRGLKVSREEFTNDLIEAVAVIANPRRPLAPPTSGPAKLAHRNVAAPAKRASRKK